MSSENEKKEGKAADAALLDDFNSQWFYVYRFAGHYDPVSCYRIPAGSSVAYANVPAEIDKIYARLSSYVSFGTSVADITWRHKGYIVILLEDAKQLLTGVDFERRRPASGLDVSFTGGRLLATVAGNPDVSCFYCVNLMQSAAGADLEYHEAEVYYVGLNHRPRGGGETFRGHEDSGTNLGPPRT